MQRSWCRNSIVDEWLFKSQPIRCRYSAANFSICSGNFSAITVFQHNQRPVPNIVPFCIINPFCRPAVNYFLMACESCRSQARTLLRTAIRASAATRAPAATKFLRVASQPTTIQTATTIRSFGTTKSRNILGSSFRDAYRVVGESEKLYKACAKPADYRITEDERKNDEVQRLEDGEEVGQSLNKDNVWHSSMYFLGSGGPSYTMTSITTNF